MEDTAFKTTGRYRRVRAQYSQPSQPHLSILSSSIFDFASHYGRSDLALASRRRKADMRSFIVEQQYGRVIYGLLRYGTNSRPRPSLRTCAQGVNELHELRLAMYRWALLRRLVRPVMGGIPKCNHGEHHQNGVSKTGSTPVTAANIVKLWETGRYQAHTFAFCPVSARLVVPNGRKITIVDYSHRPE